MAIYFLGDLHLNQWKQFATILPSGLNSRLVEQMKVVGLISSYLTEEDTVIFLGDLIDSYSETLSKVIYSAAYYTVKSWASKCKHVYLLVGNHDIYRVINILTSFNEIPNVTIVDGSWTRKVEEYTIDMVSWEKSIPEVKGDILCAHLMPLGASLGAYTTKRTDIGVDTETLEEYRWAIFGHVHEPQILPKNVICPGSIMQLNLSSSPADRFLLKLDKGKLDEIHIPSTKIYPLIISSQKEADKFVNGDHNPGYYKLSVQDINIKLPKFDYTVTVEYDVKPTSGKDMEDIAEMDIKEAIHEFVDKSNTTIDKTVAKELIDNLY